MPPGRADRRERSSGGGLDAVSPGGLIGGNILPQLRGKLTEYPEQSIAFRAPIQRHLATPSEKHVRKMMRRVDSGFRERAISDSLQTAPGSKPMKRVVIHSDGGCHGNPGPGGWAAILEYGPHRRELSGGEPATTNNRMELQAAIEALTALKEPCEVDFYTDSEYVRKGVSDWLSKWKRNGWMTSAKRRVKNEDLWRALDACSSRHRVKWHWVKGHAEIKRLKRKVSREKLVS
jgi:ribonuclease HI